LIGSDQRRATFVAIINRIFGMLAFVLASTGVACAAGHSTTAAASAAPVSPRITVTMATGATETPYVTQATTVADFLAERGIVVTPADRVSPPADTPLADGTRVDFHAAVPVQLIVRGEVRDLSSSAPDVATLLSEEHIALGASDRVEPQQTDALTSGMVVRVTHETAWTALRKQLLPPRVIQRYDPALPAGTTKTLFPGRSGEREITVHFVQRDDRPIEAESRVSRIVRHSRPRVILRGIGEYAGFARLAQRGFDATIGLARSALHMIATAYTASCAGCTGFAANGMRAGHGIVAVDPAVIPLGTRLFIPGYGRAVAGDTGGAIVGHRIDLGFNSLGDALQFGRRLITVFVLR